MRGENVRRKQERDLLKRAAAFLRADRDPVSAYRIISAEKAELPDRDPTGEHARRVMAALAAARPDRYPFPDR